MSVALAGPVRIAPGNAGAAPTPWSAATIGVVSVLHVVALGLLLSAWFGASTRALPDEQIPWLNLGVVGIMVAGAANVVWLLVARRAVAGRARAASARIHTVLPEVDAAPPVVLRATEDLVVAAGQQTAHVATCPLVRGKQADLVTTPLPACRVCQP
ncbi:MAG: hypothetical protein JWM64_1696 [Frankiales bacterium]|nr:hypothetical protein [Frankiales bacterium]